MTRRWMFGLLLLGGCGRFDFDEQPEAPQPQEKAAPTLAYPERVNAIAGKTLVKLLPVVSDKDVTFSASPALPTGLTLDEQTGEISGVIQTLQNLAPYTITAANEAGSASATILVSSLWGNEVDRVEDQKDLDEGFDAICSVTATAGDGCTFRAAYETALHYVNPLEVSEEDLRRPRVVILPAGTFRLENPQLGPKRNVVISGAGPGKTIITSIGNFPLMHLDVGPTLRLENLTVADFKSGDGGALRISKGTLEVFNVAFENNEAFTNAGGVICADGGSVVDIDAATFTNNQAVTNSGWGGVINGAGAGTRISVRRSTAVDNQARWGSFAHLEAGATLHLESSTLVGNTAIDAGTLASPGGHYTVVNSTIVGNRSLSSRSGGIFLYNDVAKYTLHNTLLAGNKGGVDVVNCSREPGSNGTLESLGGNVFGDGAGGCAASLQASGDLLSADLKLSPEGLAENGGLTRTLAILPGSAAADRGTSCPATDQRGVPRDAAKCDAGAYELP